MNFSGLQRRIRHESPFALFVYCRNHRIALCLVHLINNIQYFKKLIPHYWHYGSYLSFHHRSWLFPSTFNQSIGRNHLPFFVQLLPDGCRIFMHLPDLFQGTTLFSQLINTLVSSDSLQNFDFNKRCIIF